MTKEQKLRKIAHARVHAEQFRPVGAVGMTGQMLLAGHVAWLCDELLSQMGESLPPDADRAVKMTRRSQLQQHIASMEKSGFVDPAMTVEEARRQIDVLNAEIGHGGAGQ